MRAIFCLGLAAITILVPVAACAVDFTPQQVVRVEDGMPTRRFAFMEGKREIFFRPAKGWRISGGGDEITFYPPPPLDGFARLMNSPVPPATPFDAWSLPTYRAAAATFLPKDAENVAVVSEKPNAYPLDDWKSFEVWFSYDLRGVKSRRWVLFVTMKPDRQICYVVDAQETNLAKVYETARLMFGSWFEPPFATSDVDPLVQPPAP